MAWGPCWTLPRSRPSLQPGEQGSVGRDVPHCSPVSCLSFPSSAFPTVCALSCPPLALSSSGLLCLSQTVAACRLFRSWEGVTSTRDHPGGPAAGTFCSLPACAASTVLWVGAGFALELSFPPSYLASLWLHSGSPITETSVSRSQGIQILFATSCPDGLQSA